MTWNFYSELPLRGTPKISYKTWFSVILPPMIFLVPIILHFIYQLISNPHQIAIFDRWWILLIMFTVFSLLGTWGLNKQFRCKICNISMAKRIHSLYCNSCRPYVTKMIQDWRGNLSCRLCEGEFNDYLTFLIHFRNIHSNSSKKPWIHYHPEDNAIRMII